VRSEVFGFASAQGRCGLINLLVGCCLCFPTSFSIVCRCCGCIFSITGRAGVPGSLSGMVLASGWTTNAK